MYEKYVLNIGCNNIKLAKQSPIINAHNDIKQELRNINIQLIKYSNALKDIK